MVQHVVPVEQLKTMLKVDGLDIVGRSWLGYQTWSGRSEAWILLGGLVLDIRAGAAGQKLKTKTKAERLL
jgi:hypothetical protein